MEFRPVSWRTRPRRKLRTSCAINRKHCIDVQAGISQQSLLSQSPARRDPHRPPVMTDDAAPAPASDSTALDALPVGTAVGGYAIRRVLGQGGFGITYEAHNRVTGKEVAIKEFFPGTLARRDGQSRLSFLPANAELIAWALRKFEETTTTLCGLKHPNIVEVYDYVPANQTGYMIMELLDGGTLKDRLKGRDEPMSLAELRPFVEPVMEALAYIHGKGLIHRDIAPDNIQITSKDRPVLIDFGSVSQDLSQATKQLTGTIGLTKRHYTAPEQMSAKARPSPAADIYSMGAVLYRALGGNEPADGQDRLHALHVENVADPYETLAAKRVTGCPAPTARAIDAALAMRPENRPRSMEDLRKALDAPPDPVVAPSSRPSGKWFATAAALALLAAGGGLGGGYFLGTNFSPVGPAPVQSDAGEREKLEAGQRDLAQRQAELATLRDQLDGQQRKNGEEATRLARLKDEVDSERQKNDRDKQDLDGKRQALVRDQQGLDALSKRLEAEQEQIDQLRKNGSGSDALIQQLASLRRQLDALMQENGRLQGQLDGERRTNESLRGDISRLQSQVNDLNRENGNLRTQISDLQRQLEIERQRSSPSPFSPPTPAPQPPPFSQPRRNPIIATSRSGWVVSYDANLLEVSPEVSDLNDRAKDTFTTRWRSKRHDRVAFFIQTIANGGPSGCRGAKEFALKIIAPRRDRIERSELRTSKPGFTGYILEGQGLNNLADAGNLSFLDFVIVRNSDESTIYLVQARYPSEYGDTYRPEVVEFLKSFKIPERDVYSGRC